MRAHKYRQTTGVAAIRGEQSASEPPKASVAGINTLDALRTSSHNSPNRPAPSIGGGLVEHVHHYPLDIKRPPRLPWRNADMPWAA